MDGNITKKLNLRRRQFIMVVFGSVVATLMLVLPKPFDARAQGTYEFKMAHSEAIGSPITNAFENWGKMLKERSGGRIEPKHFPAGQLGNYTQLIEGSRLGTIQATAGGPDTEEAVAPEIAITGLGFIFNHMTGLFTAIFLRWLSNKITVDCNICKHFLVKKVRCLLLIVTGSFFAS